MNFLYARKPMLSLFVFIIIGAIIGSVLGAGEWIAIKKSQDHISLLKDKSETKPSPVTDSSSRQTETTVIVKTKEQEQPTAEEIAEALKKKIEPHIKSNEAIKYPPDITKARQILITSTNQFEPNFREKLKDVSTIVPGYFEFSADPSPNSVYSYPSVNTKDNFSTHFYASIRLAAMENVQTMDFMGRDIWVVVAPGWNGYLIYETEQLQTSWRPIRVKTDPVLNTLGIYQKGRNVSIFINNQYVDSYTKAIPPQAGTIHYCSKSQQK